MSENPSVSDEKMALEKFAPKIIDEAQWARKLVGAVSRRDELAVAVLMKKRASGQPFVARGQLAVDLARAAAPYPATLALLLPSLDLNARGAGLETPLMAVAEHGALKSLRMILAGSDPTAVDGTGNTALMRAIGKGQQRSPSVLAALSEACDPKAKNKNGACALFMLATAPEDPDGMAAFSALAALSDVNAASKNGHTPLMAAARDGRAEKVRELLKIGADANLQTRHKGETALGMAIAHQRGECVAALWPATRPEIKDHEGKTALFRAIESGRFDLFEGQLGAASGSEIEAVALALLRTKSSAGAARLEAHFLALESQIARLTQRVKALEGEGAEKKGEIAAAAQNAGAAAKRL